MLRLEISLADPASALQVEKRFEFVEGLDVVRRGRRTRNAGTQRLDGADAEADTDGDLRIVIITYEENLIGLWIGPPVKSMKLCARS